MSIAFICPTCGKLLKVRDDLAGKKGKCPGCAAIVRIPAPESPSPQPALEPIPAEPKPVAQPEPEPELQQSAPEPESQEPESEFEPELQDTMPAPDEVFAVETPHPSAVSLLHKHIEVPAPSGASIVNILGIASLALGILAVSLCWFIGIWAVSLAILGLVVAGVGLFITMTTDRSSLMAPLAGSIVCVIGICVVLLGTGILFKTARGAGSTAPTQARGAASGPAMPLPGSSPAAAPRVSKAEYLPKLVLSNVSIGETILGDKAVSGEIKNAGDQSVRQVEMTVYCLDGDGKDIFEKKFRSNLYTDVDSKLRDKPVLAPGDGAQFGCNMEGAPKTWTNNKVRVVVTDFDFAD